MIDDENYTRIEWHKKSAKQGYVKAQFTLGLLYLHSLGVEQDYTQALKYISIACEGEDPEGCYNLANLYDNGWGVERDIARAVVLYDQACNSGYQPSCDALLELAGLEQ